MMEQQESKLKALSTSYDGYTFRSRNEAKWAAFFKYLGIKYIYEDTDISDGRKRVLPDFYLPDFGVYLEVKHNGFTKEERHTHIDKYGIIPITTGKPCIIAYGDPKEMTTGSEWNNSLILLRAVEAGESISTANKFDGFCNISISSNNNEIFFSFDMNNRFTPVSKQNGKWVKTSRIYIENIYHRDVEKVALYARQLQFEYVSGHPDPDSDDADKAIETVWRSKHAPKAVYVGSSLMQQQTPPPVPETSWGMPAWAR